MEGLAPATNVGKFEDCEKKEHKNQKFEKQKDELNSKEYRSLHQNMDKYMENEQKEEDSESSKIQEKQNRHDPVKQDSGDFTEDKKPKTIVDAATRQPM
uniref:Uncharacterized protein n=1 Tax=Panagrolaimus davidi TaxID=227884 RepID=A0A914PJY6_9BILA